MALLMLPNKPSLVFYGYNWDDHCHFFYIRV